MQLRRRISPQSVESRPAIPVKESDILSMSSDTESSCIFTIPDHAIDILSEVRSALTNNFLGLTQLKTTLKGVLPAKHTLLARKKKRTQTESVLDHVVNMQELERKLREKQEKNERFRNSRSQTSSRQSSPKQAQQGVPGVNLPQVKTPQVNLPKIDPQVSLRKRFIIQATGYQTERPKVLII
jgi:hypothetical protein